MAAANHELYHCADGVTPYQAWCWVWIGVQCVWCSLFTDSYAIEDAIEFHIFAPLETLPCVWTISFHSGGHALTYRLARTARIVRTLSLVRTLSIVRTLPLGWSRSYLPVDAVNYVATLKGHPTRAAQCNDIQGCVRVGRCRLYIVLGAVRVFTLDSAVLGLGPSGCGCCAVSAFSDRILHSRMPLDPTHVRLKLLHSCDQ
jgi:hypothetical protein